MPITGKEIANASNVKAAFKKLFSDTSLARKLRKNMGLGDTLGPLPVENGGTGVTDNTYIENGFRKITKDYIDVKNWYVNKEDYFSTYAVPNAHVEKAFAIDEHTLCMLSSKGESSGLKIGIELYDIDAYVATDKTVSTKYAYTVPGIGSARNKFLSANGSKNKDGSTSLHIEIAILADSEPYIIISVYNVSVGISSNGAVTGSYKTVSDHQLAGCSIAKMMPKSSFFKRKDGSMCIVMAPYTTTKDYTDNKMYFSACAKNGAYSAAKKTFEKEYKETIWPNFDHESVFASQGAYVSVRSKKIITNDVDNFVIEVNDDLGGAISDTRNNIAAGYGFSEQEKALMLKFVKGTSNFIDVFEVSKTGDITKKETIPTCSFGQMYNDNISGSDNRLYSYDEKFGPMIFFGYTDSKRENIYLDKYKAFFEIGSPSMIVREYRIDYDHVPMKHGGRTFLISNSVYSSSGSTANRYVRIVGF